MLELQLARLDARELEQIVDQIREPLGVALDELDEAFRGFGIVVHGAQRLGCGAHRRERAAQLVGRIRHEVAPDRFQAAQLGHVHEHREHAAR